MKSRTLIIATALVSSLLGGTAVYIALTVPNDIRAASLLKDARAQLEKGNEAAAREKLTHVLQQYPRTDAAASATVALLAITDDQTARLRKQIAAAEKQSREQNRQQNAAIAAVTATVKELSARPAPAPPPAPVVQPAPAKKPEVRKAPPKRSTRKAPAKRTTTRRRR